MRIRPRGLVIVSILIVAGLIVSWVFGSLMVRPNRSKTADAKPPAQDISIATSDGVTLAATYWPGRTLTSPAILILHGQNASRTATASNAQWFAHQGFAVLTIDFRGHGQSTSRLHTFGVEESQDAAAAFGWLRQHRPRAKIGVIGISLGGAASLLGQGPLPADAFVLQAVYPDIRHAIRNRIASIVTTGPAYLMEPFLSFQSKVRFGLWPGDISPISRLSRVHSPVLIIGGGADQYTPPSETKQMFNAAVLPKETWIAQGEDHVGVSDLRSHEYRQRVAGFLTASMGSP